MNRPMINPAAGKPRKQGRRPHFIPEWAEEAGLDQVDIVNETGADKGVVSRWFSGSTPGVEYQLKLAQLFNCEPDDLFKRPGEAWISKIVSPLGPDDLKKVKGMLKAMFGSD